MQKIEIRLCNLSKQKITELIEAFLELGDNYIRLVYRFHADEPQKDDESLGWESVYTDLDIHCQKEKISAIEISRINKPPRWKIMVSVSGCSEDLKVYFKSREEAQEMKDKILKWWLKNE